jgi:TRAP-type C4-dicarboxylate transport system permease small subunit
VPRFLSAVETTAAVFLLLIALLTAGNVLLRDLLGIQIPDWFDGTKMLQAIALFWGIALATWHGTHICVDLLWEHLRAPGRRVVDLVATAVTAAALVPLAWMVWVKVLRTGTQATMDLRLPLTPFYAVAALGATVAVVLALWRLIVLRRTQPGAPDGP